MTAFDQTALFWDISLNVAKQQGLDEVSKLLPYKGVSCDCKPTAISAVQARIRKLRAAQILRSLAAKSSFTLAAIELVRSDHRVHVQSGSVCSTQHYCAGAGCSSQPSHSAHAKPTPRLCSARYSDLRHHATSSMHSTQSAA